MSSREEDRGNEESKMAETIEELSKQIATWRERAEVSESKSKEQTTLDRELEKLRLIALKISWSKTRSLFIRYILSND